MELAQKGASHSSMCLERLTQQAASIWNWVYLVPFLVWCSCQPLLCVNYATHIKHPKDWVLVTTMCSTVVPYSRSVGGVHATISRQIESSIRSELLCLSPVTLVSSWTEIYTLCQTLAFFCPMHVSKQGLAFILVHEQFHSSPLVQWEEQLFSISLQQCAVL